jgi:hypothetical protein
MTSDSENAVQYIPGEKRQATGVLKAEITILVDKQRSAGRKAADAILETLEIAGAGLCRSRISALATDYRFERKQLRRGVEAKRTSQVKGSDHCASAIGAPCIFEGRQKHINVGSSLEQSFETRTSRKLEKRRT